MSGLETRKFLNSPLIIATQSYETKSAIVVAARKNQPYLGDLVARQTRTLHDLSAGQRLIGLILEAVYTIGSILYYVYRLLAQESPHLE